MKQVGISELKAHLSQYLAAVRRGASLIVLDRSTPIAQLAPITSKPTVEVMPAPGDGRDFWRVPASKAPPPDLDVVALLLEGRARR